MPSKLIVISDSTAETAWRLANSALRQFNDVQCEIIRVPDIRGKSDLQALFKKFDGQLHRDETVLIYTFADAKMREAMVKMLNEQNLRGVDLIGPVIAQLEAVVGAKPVQVPGLQYRYDDKYDARMQAIEYTVKHDDGLGLATLAEADIILVGPSRTGKTPLSMYLALGGYRVANIPFFLGLPLPTALDRATKSVIIGLVIQPDALLKFRKDRVRKSGTDQKSSGYAVKDVVKQELVAARNLYEQKHWPIVDVTSKAIEEVAIEVLARVAPNLATI